MGGTAGSRFSKWLGAAAAGLCAVVFSAPLRPYEFVWANRVRDEFPPVLRLERADGWRIAASNAEASVSTSADLALFGESVVRLDYRATGEKPFVRLVPPSPVALTEAFDTLTLWVYGNNIRGKPCPPVRIAAEFETPSGETVSRSLGSVAHKEWFLQTNVAEPLPRAQKSTGLGGDVCNYMFGSTSIFAMTPGDFGSTLVLAFLVLAIYLFFYQKFFLVSFDESFGKAIGVRVSFYNTLLAVLTAVTIVIGMKMMGAMLISSLIVFPTLTAVRVCKTFRSVTIASGVLSVTTYVIGFALSIALSTPPGATIVIVDILVFLLFCVIGSLRSRRKAVKG